LVAVVVAYTAVSLIMSARRNVAADAVTT
jgi:hypothetical protein